ncbi:hypothetical protein Tco_1090290 [Tanacetum coccineum]|uniref:Uncharacterized protein n=1 Tax=Tanacetum coccineum TaxID=301880 RepID=A0ABQ5I3S4_9ASTR
MSADSAVTYTSVHSEARSWSIPSEDPYEEVARQLLEQAPTPPLPPSFLSLRIRPLHTRAAMRQMRAAAPSTYHSLLPSGTPPLLPIPLPAPSTSRRADIPEADTPPRKRLLLTTPRPGCEVGESSAAAAARQPGPTMARRVDCSSIDTMETRVRDTERRMMAALEVVNARVSYQVDVRSRESSCSTISNQYTMASQVRAGVLDVDVYLLASILSTRDIGVMIHEDGDNDAISGNDDERAINNVVEEEDGERICFLGGNSYSGTKKYRGSNSSDGGNTGDGVKIAGGVIGSGDEIEFFEELKELLSDEAEK